MLRDTPGFRMHLVESNSRKCAFLRDVARGLNLPVTVHDGRIEDIVAALDDSVRRRDRQGARSLTDLLGLSRKLLTSGAPRTVPEGSRCSG